MAPIDVRAQRRLSLARIFGLSLKGIKHRLFRSSLTTAVIVLAVAFFAVLLSDSVIARAVDRGVGEESRQLRRPAVVADLWLGRPEAHVLAGRLAGGTLPPALATAITDWPEAQVQALAEACRRQRLLLDWLDDIDAGTRAMLVQWTLREDVLAWLAPASRWQEFAGGLAQLRSVRPPLPAAELRAVVDAAGPTASELERFTQAWNKRIDATATALAALTGTREAAGCIAWLAAADDAGARAFAGVLATQGFAADGLAEEILTLRHAFRIDGCRQRAATAFASDAGRQAWQAAFRSQPPLEEKLAALDDAKAVAIVAPAATAAERADFSAVAQLVVRERTLARRATALAGRVDPDGGLVPVRQGFLIAISFLVCMVGIANAMLMAITERFREIATMKCLGATDGFILSQFLIEAGLQGAGGGVIGSVLGLLIALGKGSWAFGGHMWIHLPWLGLVATGLACVLAGLVLATIASLYPSWMASRMAPMEAMRLE